MKKIIGGSLMALMLVVASCASAPPASVGTWDIEMNIPPLGVMPAVLTIAEDGTGSMSGDLGQQSISDIMMDGNSVSFSTAIDAQGTSISLTFNGTVEGDSLTGEIGSDFGAFDVTGTRQ